MRRYFLDKETLKSYEEVKKDYPTILDNDPSSAYALMIKASTLMETFDTQIALMYKELAFAEQKAKATTAEKSSEFSNKVAVGDRHTLSDPDCQEAWAMVAEAQYSIRLLEAASKFLNRVYFDMKNNVAFNRGVPRYEEQKKG